MSCQRCYPTLSQEEIDRRNLPCRKRCQAEGGCPRCASRLRVQAVIKKLHQLHGGDHGEAQ